MTELILHTKTFLPVKDGNEELLKLIHNSKSNDFTIKFNGTDSEYISESFSSYDKHDIDLVMLFKFDFTRIGNDEDRDKTNQCDDFINEIIPIIKEKLGFKENAIESNKINIKEEDTFIDTAICKNCKHYKKVLDELKDGNSKFHYTCKLKGGNINPNDHCMNWESNSKTKREKENKEIIKENKDYSELQKDVLIQMSLKNYDEASELIVKEIEKENFIYTTKNDIKSEMWIYAEGVYKPNGKTYIKEFSRNILDATYTSFIANIIISKIETDTYIEEEKFFINDNIDELPVENGILNVKTRELLEFDPKKIFFNKLPVEYDKEATCESIDKFLKDILTKEEDVIVAYEIVGSGLLKEYFTEKAAMLVGSGRNGKSKFLELIKRLCNIENTCSVPIRSMKEDNSSLCELHGKLFNLAGDLSGGDLKDTGMFKQTVGRDIIQAHRKFLRDLKFVNYAKHLFACNELPRVFDTTDGFWDKWVLLKFPYKFVTQEEKDKLPELEKINIKIKDPEIVNKISTPEELSGFLNKALNGLDRLLKQHNFSQTEGSTEIKDYWIRNSDSFVAFCIDNIEEDYQSYIPKKQIRSMFSKYCKRHKVKGAGDKGIKAILEDRYGAYSGSKFIDNTSEYIWEGIKFK